jgi:hypothetical protein
MWGLKGMMSDFLVMWLLLGLLYLLGDVRRNGLELLVGTSKPV